MTKYILVLIVSALLSMPLALAEPESTKSRSAIRDTFKEPPVAESPEEPEARLTKNWGGARTRLSEAGIDIALIYKIDSNNVVSGGADKKSEFLGNIDLRTSFDLEKLAGWSGGNFFLYILGHHGGDPSENVGDIQGTSNIQAPVHTAKLYEAWFQQIALDGTASFLFGLHDLNSEFYVTPASTLFLNSSFGIGAEFALTGANGPSIFPSTAPSFRVRVEPAANYYVQAGLFGAVAGNPDEPYGTQISWKAEDGFLFVNEFAYQSNTEKNDTPAKYGVGVWTYTVPEEATLSAGDETAEKVGNYGGYALIEQGLTQELVGFLRYGLKTSKTRELSSNVSAGLNLAAPFGRELDSAGIAFTRAGLAKDFREAAGIKGSHETTLELTYRLQAIPGIAVQPDLQYVVQPGGDPSAKSVLVVAARLELSF